MTVHMRVQLILIFQALVSAKPCTFLGARYGGTSQKKTGAEDETEKFQKINCLSIGMRADQFFAVLFFKSIKLLPP